MSIDIYASDKTTKKMTVDAVLSSNLHQSLNGECTFSLSMPGTRLPGVDLGDELHLGDLYFDVTRISRASQTAGELFSLSCEHISYILADANMPEGEITGTPAAGLAAILSGTGLSAGTVDVSGTHSMTVKDGTSRRDALQGVTSCALRRNYPVHGNPFPPHRSQKTSRCCKDRTANKAAVPAVTADPENPAPEKTHVPAESSSPYPSPLRQFLQPGQDYTKEPPHRSCAAANGQSSSPIRRAPASLSPATNRCVPLEKRYCGFSTGSISSPMRTPRIFTL